MRNVVLITLILSFISCGQNNNGADEPKNLSTELVERIIDYTGSDTALLPLIDSETGELDSGFFNGFYSKNSEDSAIQFVYENKEAFKEEGFLLFSFDGDHKRFGISVIQGTDELDIIRYRRTDAVNYNFLHEDVLKKFKEWDDKYGVTVLGCGRDWAYIMFDELPTNLDSFSQEVYEFCPDVIEQGLENKAELKMAIQQMRGVYLWWD